jgi:hypothetical protein
LIARVSVLYAFARSGGTLVNRCLGSMSSNLVLSEINPHASVISIEQQACEWLRLITEAELIHFSQLSYLEKIHGLLKITTQNNSHLIIRDWTTVNFLDKVVPGEYLTPSQLLEQEIYLSRYGIDQQAIVLTRRAADVYESLNRSFDQFKQLSIEEFGTAYLAYAKAVCHYPIVHYESVCQQPDTEVLNICKLLGVNYDPLFLSNFSQFTRCTGDTMLQQPSRGMQLNVIKPLKSHQDSAFYLAASRDRNCQQADELFNYAV